MRIRDTEITFEDIAGGLAVALLIIAGSYLAGGLGGIAGVAP